MYSSLLGIGMYVFSECCILNSCIVVSSVNFVDKLRAFEKKQKKTVVVRLGKKKLMIRVKLDQERVVLKTCVQYTYKMRKT